MIDALAVDPAGSINANSQGWAETAAAYRFFDNRLVTPDKILQPHRDRLHPRVAHLRTQQKNTTMTYV